MFQISAGGHYIIRLYTAHASVHVYRTEVLLLCRGEVALTDLLFRDVQPSLFLPVAGRHATASQWRDGY